MTDRELVEGYWKKAEFRPEDKMMPQYGGRIISYGSGEFLTDSHLSESEAWAAAAAYTREHQEKVRLVDEEIEEIRRVMNLSSGRYYAVYDRILAKLQAEKEGLLRGVKR